MRLAKLLNIMGLAVALAAPSVLAAEDDPTLGQTVLVPSYSHIMLNNRDGKGDPSTLLLSSMLTVRNPNAKMPVTLKSVAYYSTEGKKLREFITQPKSVPPLGASEFFVEYRDKEGGAGASFLVVWEAAQPARPIVAESVNAYFFGTQSLAFTSPGRVVEQKDAKP
jgi:hypothetical protein